MLIRESQLYRHKLRAVRSVRSLAASLPRTHSRYQTDVTVSMVAGYADIFFIRRWNCPIPAGIVVATLVIRLTRRSRFAAACFAFTSVSNARSTPRHLSNILYRTIRAREKIGDIINA